MTSLHKGNCIMGVDPGASGAVAFYYPDSDTIELFDAPVVNGEIDVANLVALVEEYRPAKSIVELVGAMPKQGVSSTFKFGVSFGAVKGVIGALRIPVHFVAPTKWKRYFNLLGADKEESRQRALQLWPGVAPVLKRKKDHGRAEAALLARYCAETAVSMVHAGGRGAAGGEGKNLAPNSPSIPALEAVPI